MNSDHHCELPNMKTYSIIDLLPQNNMAVVRDTKMIFEILKATYNVIALLIDSISKFHIDKQYQHFDPHVGESACQIRAYMCIILARKKYSSTYILERIEILNTYLYKLNEIIHAKINYKNSSHSIVELIKKYDCYFDVSWEECFLFKSYFLTIFKREHLQETYISSHDVATTFIISKKLAKKIIHRYQYHLSEISCSFIEHIASELNINKKNSPNFVSSVLNDDDGRMVYPCFFYSKIIFMHMKKTNCPILLIVETIDNGHIKKDYILFGRIDGHGQLLNITNNPLMIDDICVVIVCSRITSIPASSIELLKILNAFGLYDILLMNMAAHPQFGGLKLSICSERLSQDNVSLSGIEKQINEEFVSFKERAQKNGFCRNNPSTLLVKHIFMNSVNKQLYSHQNFENEKAVADI